MLPAATTPEMRSYQKLTQHLRSRTLHENLVTTHVIIGYDLIKHVIV